MTKTISADRCIYCDISGEARTDEHIIPKSIGGRLILPTATCVACQNKINKEIEDPLFGNQYVVLRDLYGLKKKDKNRDNAKYLNKQTHQNSISIVGLYNFPPFERYFKVPFSRHPPVLRVDRYANPLFMKGSDREFRTQCSSNLSLVDLASLNRFAAEILPKEGLVTSLFQFPNWTEGQFLRFLAKVACGIYFSFVPGQLDLTPLKSTVADGTDDSAKRHIFSCHVSEFFVDNYSFHIFEKMEDGVPWVYCGIRLLPTIIDEVYFFRARRTRKGEEINLRFNYSA